MGRRATKKEIEDSLVRQLQLKGANVSHFRDKIDDYMDLQTLKAKLRADLRKRGVHYVAASASGKEIDKENPSMKNYIACERAQRDILKDLGLTTDAPTGEEDLDDDL